jgi:hypothetical protein
MEQDYDNMGNPLYTIENKAFTINAKLDSYLFEGDFKDELNGDEGIAKKITVNDDGILQSTDSIAFLKWPLV